MNNVRVIVYVLLAEANKSKKVYKIEVLRNDTAIDHDDLLTCKEKNFTCNLKKAFYIAQAECKKNSLTTFEVEVTGEVAKFDLPKKEEKSEEKSE